MGRLYRILGHCAAGGQHPNNAELLESVRFCRVALRTTADRGRVKCYQSRLCQLYTWLFLLYDASSTRSFLHKLVIQPHLYPTLAVP